MGKLFLLKKREARGQRSEVRGQAQSPEGRAVSAGLRPRACRVGSCAIPFSTLSFPNSVWECPCGRNSISRGGDVFGAGGALAHPQTLPPAKRSFAPNGMPKWSFGTRGKSDRVAPCLKERRFSTADRPTRRRRQFSRLRRPLFPIGLGTSRSTYAPPEAECPNPSVCHHLCASAFVVRRRSHPAGSLRETCR